MTIEMAPPAAVVAAGGKNLAEYNAGRKRVDRWAAQARHGDKVTAAEFLATMDFPGTRQYIEDIMERYHFYQRRGHL